MYRKKEVYINYSSYDNTTNIIKMLKNNTTKKIIISFLNEVTNLELKDVIFDGIEKFKTIVEYNFYIINLIGITKYNKKKKIFLKSIKKGKIKESLFCICDLAYEKCFDNKNSKENIKDIKRITILEEKEKKKNIHKVSVNLFQNNSKERQEYIEIYFIEINQFLKINQNKERKEKSIEMNVKDILILGIKSGSCDIEKNKC